MGKKKIAEIDVEAEKMRKNLWEKGIKVTWFWKSYGEEITILITESADDSEEEKERGGGDEPRKG
ncbi:MAG: hypothetical protein H8D26_09510 [Methanomicrobia archaeon]|nr:hypothetical protein [Methanomicrobia archaeon]